MYVKILWQILSFDKTYPHLIINFFLSFPSKNRSSKRKVSQIRTVSGLHVPFNERTETSPSSSKSSFFSISGDGRGEEGRKTKGSRMNRLSKPLLTTCRGFKVESSRVAATVSAKVSRWLQLLSKVNARDLSAHGKVAGLPDTQLLRGKQDPGNRIPRRFQDLKTCLRSGLVDLPVTSNPGRGKEKFRPGKTLGDNWLANKQLRSWKAARIDRKLEKVVFDRVGREFVHG